MDGALALLQIKTFLITDYPDMILRIISIIKKLYRNRNYDIKNDIKIFILTPDLPSWDGLGVG